ncbi:spore germination protein [Paenibacillus polysaccharolyticus]|nr:spore germination protein [Paenibacillus polysaccharolyticus]
MAFTGIASYIVPKYRFGALARLLRFPLLAVATFAGLPGLLMGFSVIAAHFINTTSFGKPYMSLTSKVHEKSTAVWFMNSVQEKD